MSGRGKSAHHQTSPFVFPPPDLHVQGEEVVGGVKEKNTG